MNDFEASARLRKATNLAFYAQANGFDAARLAAMSTEERNAFAVAAGQHKPSDTTWQGVVGALTELEAQHLDDPFAGLGRDNDRRVS